MDWQEKIEEHLTCLAVGLLFVVSYIFESVRGWLQENLVLVLSTLIVVAVIDLKNHIDGAATRYFLNHERGMNYGERDI